MLSSLGHWAVRWAADGVPFSPTVGTARTLLALCTLTTLLVNAPDLLFVPSDQYSAPLLCEGSRAIGLYCVVRAEQLELARWLSIAALFVVASGWRPRITGLVHWYVAFSLQANATVLDGGDQIAALLSLLLLPLTWADVRTWHWQDPPPLDPSRLRHAVALVVARTSLGAARVQVAVIYFLAAVGKLQVQEWVNGTALYYWFRDPTIGAPPWLDPALAWLFEHGTLLAFITWSVMLLECALAAAIVMERRYRTPMFCCGVMLHAGVLIIHGIASLSVTMIAALLLYLGSELQRAPSHATVALRGAPSVL